jgi:hypothetical protein
MTKNIHPQLYENIKQELTKIINCSTVQSRDNFIYYLLSKENTISMKIYHDIFDVLKNYDSFKLMNIEYLNQKIENTISTILNNCINDEKYLIVIKEILNIK